MQKKSYGTAKQRLDWWLQQNTKDEIWHQIIFVNTKAVQAEEGQELSEFELAQIERAKRFCWSEPEFLNRELPPWMFDYE